MKTIIGIVGIIGCLAVVALMLGGHPWLAFALLVGVLAWSDLRRERWLWALMVVLAVLIAYDVSVANLLDGWRPVDLGPHVGYP